MFTGIFIFSRILFYMRETHNQSNMVQSYWNFSYNFNMHLATYGGVYYRIYAPLSKQKLLICNALTFWK